MDETTLHKNADRVATIFNVLSIVVVIVGVLTAIGVLITGIVGAGLTRSLSEYTSSSEGSAAGLVSIVGGVIGAIIVAVYTLIAWASVQLAALVAGYIKVKTTLPPPTMGPNPQFPSY